MDILRHRNAYSEVDFSYDLADADEWKLAVIRELVYVLDVSALAVEPTSGLVAYGTKTGNILLVGAPPTCVILHVPNAAAVKFIHFAALVYKLVCVDVAGTLHVWDLGQLGRPKLAASEPFKEPVCSLALSPCHSHVFVGLERRRIVMTYDLLCLHRSPYFIADLWKERELRMVQAGMTSSGALKRSDLIDIALHPRDLSLVFIAYSGGVVLYNLIERQGIHFFELVIPPGAPGASGYYDSDIMKLRNPELTAIAVHASGQLFVTGHLDGTIAFWAVEDEEQPLMVRSIDRMDVNYPDGEQLDKALSRETSTSSDALQFRLGPVFKLNWCSFGSQTISDPYTGNSVLAILGGLSSQDGEKGLMTLRIPSLNLPSPTSAPVARGIQPELRKALSKFFSSTEGYLYCTSGEAIDFLIIPKENPHFGGCLDPVSILIVHERPEGQRTIEAKEFPPPTFALVKEVLCSSPTSSMHNKEKRDSGYLETELSNTLESLKLTSLPQDLSNVLPSATWIGMNGICDGDIVQLEKDKYALLQSNGATSPAGDPSKISRGGLAWVDYSDALAQEVAGTKRQPNRLLVTHHQDYSIRFQDISPQLLIGSSSSPLITPYPDPLPRLTIRLTDLVVDSQIVGAYAQFELTHTKIQSAYLTPESCECMVVMRNGHIIVFSFDDRHRYTSNPVARQEGLIILEHIPAEAGTFQPRVMIPSHWGAVTAYDLSDIGFLAVAYSNGSLAIIDLRGPKFILREEGDIKARRISALLHHSEDEKKVVILKWFICGFGDDPTLRVRLLACRRSGASRVYTLLQTAGQSWQVEGEAKKLECSEHPLPRGAFVINARDGISCTASQKTFKAAFRGLRDIGTDAVRKDVHCFWITAGEFNVRCHANFVGRRAGKADWGQGRNVECVEVIDRSGAQALVAIMDTREVLVYSLPGLETIQVFQLNRRPNSAICLDNSGEFVDWTFDPKTDTISGLTLGTLFAKRRVFDEPMVDFATGRRAVPRLPQPVPLASINQFGAWFNFNKSISGDVLDDLLAGPKRPVPPDMTTSAVITGEWQAQMQNRARAIADQATRAGSDIFANLSSSVAQRGEAIESLSEHVRSLEEGGRKMMLEAKKLALKQSGKGWFGF